MSICINYHNKSWVTKFRVGNYIYTYLRDEENVFKVSRPNFDSGISIPGTLIGDSNVLTSVAFDFQIPVYISN